MANNTCLYLKPRATKAKGRETRDDFAVLIESSINLAELAPLGESGKGLEVDDISMDLVELVHQADVVVVDAAQYEETKPDGAGFPLCPFLYYYLALSHTLGNKTIIVTDAAAHLPPSLVGPHTVVCADQSNKARETFKDRFLKVAQAILEADIKPDNPIQAYLKAVEMDELERAYRRAQAEVSKLKAKGDESQAAEVMLKAKERIQEQGAKIVFRRVSDAEGAGQ